LVRIDALSSQLARDTPALMEAVDQITPAVQVLSGQRDELNALLAAVGPLAESSADLIDATRDDLVAALEAAKPVVDVLAGSQETLTRSFHGLIAFGTKTDDASPGDFSNFDLTFLLHADALNPLAGQTRPTNPEVEDTEEP